MVGRSIAAIAALLLTMSAGTAGAEVVVKEFKLLTAAGVPAGPVHRYTFSARMEFPGSSSSSGWGPFKKTTVTNPGSFFAIGEARWDKATGEAIEHLKISGAATGKVRSTFTCGSDPWLGGGCTFVSAQADDEQMITAAQAAGKPFTAGRVNPLEAEALSNKQPKASNSPPPPPAGAKSDWKAARAAEQTVAPSAVPVAKPSLVVIGVQPKFDPGCPNPAQPLVAAVSIRHAGLPLSAGKGHMTVFEVWGTNLKSKSVALPSFGANDVRVVEVPVHVSSASVPGLPGAHKLGVDLVPLVASGQPAFAKPGEAFVFAVTFPPGYCQPKFRAGDQGTSGSKAIPGTGTQVPAVQRPVAPSNTAPPTR